MLIASRWRWTRLRGTRATFSIRNYSDTRGSPASPKSVIPGPNPGSHDEGLSTYDFHERCSGTAESFLEGRTDRMAQMRPSSFCSQTLENFQSRSTVRSRPWPSFRCSASRAPRASVLPELGSVAQSEIETKEIARDYLWVALCTLWLSSPPGRSILAWQ